MEIRNKKSAIYLVISFTVVSLLVSCSTCREKERLKKYGVLSTAVTFSANKVYGVYGRKLPSGFNNVMFMDTVKNKIPEESYEALSEYNLNVTPKGSYYLLIADEDGKLILFDYSCTSELDGPVYENPGRYNTVEIDSYDVCRKHAK